MQSAEISNACLTSRSGSEPLCATPCTGHGTTCNCPPLIVLAVLSQEQANASAAEGAASIN